MVFTTSLVIPLLTILTAKVLKINTNVEIKLVLEKLNVEYNTRYICLSKVVNVFMSYQSCMYTYNLVLVN